MDSSITAAICIFGNDLTARIANDHWGNTPASDIDDNQYATFVYWPNPLPQDTEEGEEESSSGIQAVAKVGIFALGTLAWII